MNIPTLSESHIIEVLTKGAGTQYTCKVIANKFKAKQPETTVVLKKLVSAGHIRSIADGHKSRYYVPTKAQIEAEKQERFAPAFRPLIGYAEMMRGFASRAEAGR